MLVRSPHGRVSLRDGGDSFVHKFVEGLKDVFDGSVVAAPCIRGESLRTRIVQLCVAR